MRAVKSGAATVETYRCCVPLEDLGKRRCWVDLRQKAPTTSATNFTARRCAVRIEEMCEEVQRGATTSSSL